MGLTIGRMQTLALSGLASLCLLERTSIFRYSFFLSSVYSNFSVFVVGVVEDFDKPTLDFYNQ